MNNFKWIEPKTLNEASSAMKSGGALYAGGVELLCLLKEKLIEPPAVINLKTVSGLNTIDTQTGLKLGALVTVDQLSENKYIRDNFRAVAESADVIASPQIKNVGTVGGNLCQRPRCWYFRDPEVKCLKKGGGMCYAVNGHSEYHAIFGGGPCFIVHPSDLAPALIAYDADVVTNERKMKLSDFFVLPMENPYVENKLNPAEIITHVEVPETRKATKSAYYKAKERESFDWALSSCAVSLKMSGENVEDARVVLGGVAPIPWRSQDAENAIKGKPVNQQTAESAGKAATVAANPMRHNAYKIKLTENVIKIALLKAVGKITK